MTGEAKTAVQMSLSTEVAEVRGGKNLHESDAFDSLEHPLEANISLMPPFKMAEVCPMTDTLRKPFT